MFEKDILEKIENLLKPVIEGENFELIDLELTTEFGRRILRVFIDNVDGVKVDDCAKISEKISSLLDNEDIISGHYHLEVSSPGLDRILKKESDFLRFIGRLVKIKTYQPIDGQKNFVGYLREYKEQKITIEEKNIKKIVTIELPNIVKAKLEVL